MDTIALRVATTYGSGMRPNSVFSIFVGRALDGQPLVIKGSGEQFRQFTHVRDVVKGFTLALESPVHGLALNIASPECISINQLASLVAENLPTPIIHEEGRVGDIASAVISSQKARSLLGWQSSISFKEGLFEFIDEFKRENR